MSLITKILALIFVFMTAVSCVRNYDVRPTQNAYTGCPTTSEKVTGTEGIKQDMTFTIKVEGISAPSTVGIEGKAGL